MRSTDIDMLADGCDCRKAETAYRERNLCSKLDTRVALVDASHSEVGE